MKRNFSQFCDQDYDILIIGGGIYGIACAREAAFRGLKVGLVEKNDFGGQTSANSAKIAHSGMRYLQHLDIIRMRESIRERNNMHQLAPHLVESQPFLMPVYGHGIKGKETFSIYMKIYDWLSPERKRFKDPYRKVPDSRFITKEEVISIFPDVEQKGLTGAIIWYEGQMQNTERLSFAMLASAEKAGAIFLNHAEVTGFVVENNAIKSVTIKDSVKGLSRIVSCPFVINASGPWSKNIFKLIDHPIRDHGIYASKAFSLLTRSVSDKYAITFPIRSMYLDKKAVVDKKSSLQFAIPWRGKSMFASLHLACEDDLEKVTITKEEINLYIQRINEGYPNINLSENDIDHILWGIIPAESKGSAAPLKHYKIIDHQNKDGLRGFITVLGVKYTTARDVAVKAIDAIGKYFSDIKPKSNTDKIAFGGGDMDYFEDFLLNAKDKYKDKFSSSIIDKLIKTYGTDFEAVLSLVMEEPLLGEVISGTNILKAQIIYAMREEMAIHLGDVMMRRTDMGSLEYPGKEIVQSVVNIMSIELGWNQDMMQQEIKMLKKNYLTLGNKV